MVISTREDSWSFFTKVPEVTNWYIVVTPPNGHNA